MSLSIVTQYFAAFTDRQMQQLAALENLYGEWNQKINVISRKDIDSLYEKHVLHSLAIAAVFNFAPGMRVIDMGAGGGFPSLPLAIFFPSVEFLAVDSIAKKLKVIDEVAAAANIPNIRSLHSRVEQIKQPLFDVAVSRAVAPLKSLLAWSRPLLHTCANVTKRFEKDSTDERPLACGLICLKGGDLAQEIQDTNKRPLVWEIERLYQEAYFKQKYILQIPF